MATPKKSKASNQKLIKSFEQDLSTFENETKLEMINFYHILSEHAKKRSLEIELKINEAILKSNEMNKIYEDFHEKWKLLHRKRVCFKNIKYCYLQFLRFLRKINRNEPSSDSETKRT